MFSLRRSLLVLIPALALLGACGGGDDDDSGGDSDDSNGGSSSPTRSSGDASRSSNGDADIPAIKDGAFADGEVHVEVSGDKDFKVDLKGNGYATGGYTLLTFGSEEASVLLTFQADSKEEPGGLFVTHTVLATAGEWGTDCTVTVDESANEVKGEFECKDLDAVQPGTVNAYEVRVLGNFSVTR
ncbi:MAG: hypothetical protein IH609_11525 [Dehalococcoidia bacterium]|nr:hypothetical protein [Dehalococcoidia bacterium]